MPNAVMLVLALLPGIAATEQMTVHVVQSCHLDIGFAAFSKDIINEYFDHHLPLAVKVANELRDDPLVPKEWGLKFMAQSYYLSLYFDCPLGMGLHCPSQDQKDSVHAALKRGDITYHAFPHNAELALANPTVIDASLNLTFGLDEWLGTPHKTTLSQRDVPGMPRAVIPLLRRRGVSAVTVGVNGASMFPLVPKLFLWQDPISGENVSATWHPKGYGGYTRSEAAIAPGGAHALVTVWNGDNKGPMSKAQYVASFAQIKAEFVGAKVIASTFDDFFQAIEPVASKLPVVTQEIADSWIHGVASDPKKLAITRGLNRVWKEGQHLLRPDSQHDRVYLNATRLMIKNIEHTWGKDVKSNLIDNSDWTNKAFHAAKLKNGLGFKRLEESWREQRRWGIDIPIQTLKAAAHPLYNLVEKELSQLEAPEPNPEKEGFKRLQSSEPKVECGSFALKFDNVSGCMRGLSVDDKAFLEEDEGFPCLFGFRYETYSAQNFSDFMNDYSWQHPQPDWFKRDFGKPNDTSASYTSTGANLRSIWLKSNTTTQIDDCEALVQLNIGTDNSLSEDYGAPKTLWVRLKTDSQQKALFATVYAAEKTSTRQPEAMFMSLGRGMNPSAATRTEINKLDQWIAVDDNLVVDGGSKHLHAVADAGVRFSSGSGGDERVMSVGMLDAALVNLGRPSGFPTPADEAPDLKNYGVSAMLWNNLWGTNYVQWYPYDSGAQNDANLSFRFNLKFGS